MGPLLGSVRGGLSGLMVVTIRAFPCATPHTRTPVNLAVICPLRDQSHPRPCSTTGKQNLSRLRRGLPPKYGMSFPEA
eukprot:1968560-Pyramimonas_sp.AAC.1